MAYASIAGIVAGKPGQSPVTVKTFENGNSSASFSVADLAYVYTKPGEERQGQFYRCEVIGKAAEIVADRLQRGDKIKVDGQLVQRMYNERMFLDLKNSQVTFLEKRQDGSKDDAPF